MTMTGRKEHLKEHEDRKHPQLRYNGIVSSAKIGILDIIVASGLIVNISKLYFFRT